MQIIFIIIAVIGILYFLFAKRHFDFFSVAFFSASVYFLPGFADYTLTPDGFSVLQPVALVDEVYWVMIIVLLTILIVAILFDLTVRRRELKITLSGGQNTVVIAVIIALAGFLFSIKTTGSSLLSADKSAMMTQLNRWYIIWTTAASLGAVLSFIQKRWKLFFICMIFLLFDIYIGFRVSFAITLIAIFTLWAESKGKQRFAIKNWKIGVLGLLSALFLFIYKFLYIIIKIGNWNIVAERLLDKKFYFVAISTSEPFITQSILNEVIRRNFIVGMDHFMGIIYQFILFSPELGAKITSFNDIFQPSLFPGLNYGMANNIWAEMWSSGGWFLLILFAFIYATILFLGSFLLRIGDPRLKGAVSLIWSYWAFYIHRNDLLAQVGIEKRVFLFFIFCVLLSILFSLRYKWPKQYRNRHNNNIREG